MGVPLLTMLINISQNPKETPIKKSKRDKPFYLTCYALQQNVFLVTKISEEIIFVVKNTALVTKYEFRH